MARFVEVCLFLRKKVHDMEKSLLERLARLEASVSLLESADLGFTKSAGVQPLQDLAGVQTWVSKNRNDGLLDDTSAPAPSREDYQDGVPQRDRVLPLPSGHPEGRTEYRAGPPVLNAPPDSSGASLSHGQAPNPNAIPNQPDGKPLHQRPRSSALPGQDYGHPYVDAKNTTGLARRPMTASDRQAVPRAKINVRPPRQRQREQKGTVKRVTQRAYRAKKRKDRGQMARDAARHYLRNKARILLYQQRRAEKPKLHARLHGGGNSTMQQKNQHSKKAMQREAVRSVFSRMYRSYPSAQFQHIEFEASSNAPVNEKLWADVISLAKGERSTPLSVGGVEVAPVRGGEGFRKYPSAYANGWASKTYKDLGGTWKKEASHQDPALATLQVLLAILRGAHWAHWTSHWQVKGSPYYGDHQLLQRVYEGLIEEIDTLAEKIVGKYGSQAVAPVDQAQIMANTLLPIAEAEAQSDPILRALIIEEALQKVFENVYGALKQMGAMSLGMDDFIMSMANAHETFQYLLRQRTR